MQKLHSIPCLLLAAVLLAGCGAQETAQDSRPPAESIRTSMREDYTTAELVSDMGLGINLGNTLEACGDWIQGDSVTSYETAWGSPVVTEEMIAGYAKAGFQTVRIPVAWSNLMAEDYTIAPELLERVETVVQYVLDNDMYAIVNLHWDGGWIAGFSTDFDTCMEKYTRIWEQVTDTFQDYGDHLILESLNEEGCFDDLWNRYSGSDSGKAEAYGIVNDINQTFVDLVRNSGGNNARRHLLIAGYATDPDAGGSGGTLCGFRALLFAGDVLHSGGGCGLGQSPEPVGFATGTACAGERYGQAEGNFRRQGRARHHRRVWLRRQEQGGGVCEVVPVLGGWGSTEPRHVSGAVGRDRCVL